MLNRSGADESLDRGPPRKALIWQNKVSVTLYMLYVPLDLVLNLHSSCNEGDDEGARFKRKF